MFDRLHRWRTALARAPAYSLMRVAARFAVLRKMAVRWYAWRGHAKRSSQQAAAIADMGQSVFAGTDLDRAIRDLHAGGIAKGLRLPDGVVQAIRAFAEEQLCYADRRVSAGFRMADRTLAERALGKPILLAQYFNSEKDCSAIRALSNDPALRWIAARYLEAPPVFVGANLWWTFPVLASEEDRHLHAHLFHRDVDDFRFLKFFFYLTDVPAGEGAHVCVLGSHRKPPVTRWTDRWQLRRYSDEEVDRLYGCADILEVCGPAGTGFAEDTLCVHKGRTPVSQPRLLLQLQFGLVDYGVMHDRREAAQLAQLAPAS